MTPVPSQGFEPADGQIGSSGDRKGKRHGGWWVGDKMAPLFEGGIFAGTLAIAATLWRTVKEFVTGKGDKPDESDKGGSGQVGRSADGN